MCKRKLRSLLKIEKHRLALENIAFDGDDENDSTIKNFSRDSSNMNRGNNAVLVDADDFAALQHIYALRNDGDNLLEQKDHLETALKFRQIVIEKAGDRRIVGLTMTRDWIYRSHKNDGMLNVASAAASNGCRAGNETEQISVASLDALQTLVISFLESPADIPQGIWDLPQLKNLVISTFVDEVLQQLPPEENHLLLKLKSLQLTSDHMTRIPSGVGRFGDTLEELTLVLRGPIINAAAKRQANNREVVDYFFPSSLGNLKYLRKIHMFYDASEDEIWENILPLKRVWTANSMQIFSQWTNLESLEMTLNVFDLFVSCSQQPVLYPGLKRLTLHSQNADPDVDTRRFASAFKQICSQWSTTLQTLNLNIAPTMHEPYVWLSLDRLRPLLQLEELNIGYDPAVSVYSSSVVVRTSGFQFQPKHDFLAADVTFQHLFLHFPNLKRVQIGHCRFVAPPSPPRKDNDALCDANEMEKETLPHNLVHLKMTECSGLFHDATNESVATKNNASTTNVPMVDSDGKLFSSNGALLFLSKRLNLQHLQVFRCSGMHQELGDAQFSTLCQQVLIHCPELQQLDLSDNNICSLDGAITTGSEHQDLSWIHSGDLVGSTLPKDNLRILNLSRNPAFRISDDDGKLRDANIRALSFMVASFPFLGFLGKFSELVLGRLGEDYHRLGEYYRLVHHLALNRARTRVLKDQRVPRALWPRIFVKAQRAYDDYPNHLIARNRKEEPDAIFHLLIERAADEIFCSKWQQSHNLGRFLPEHCS